jgi:hypothetical protein
MTKVIVAFRTFAKAPEKGREGPGNGRSGRGEAWSSATNQTWSRQYSALQIFNTYGLLSYEPLKGRVTSVPATDTQIAFQDV